MIKRLEDFLVDISADPMKYALRIVVVAAILLFVTCSAFAAPILVGTTGEGAKVTITDEPCKLKAAGNLPARATWEHEGKKHEGCAGQHPAGIIVLYFDDNSIVLLSPAMFRRVSGT